MELCGDTVALPVAVDYVGGRRRLGEHEVEQGSFTRKP